MIMIMDTILIMNTIMTMTMIVIMIMIMITVTIMTMNGKYKQTEWHFLVALTSWLID